MRNDTFSGFTQNEAQSLKNNRHQLKEVMNCGKSSLIICVN
jgi:hypothetical protein